MKKLTKEALIKLIQEIPDEYDLMESSINTLGKQNSDYELGLLLSSIRALKYIVRKN